MLIQGFLLFCGAMSILTTVGIVVVLFEEALVFFRDPNVSLVEFFTTTAWQPKIGQFGIFPLLLRHAADQRHRHARGAATGTGDRHLPERIRLTAGTQDTEADPGSPGGHPYRRVRLFCARISSRPSSGTRSGRDVVDIFNIASAGLVIGILILPLVASMSEDALSAVPRALREAAYGLGATRLETAIKIVVPAALSGLGAAFIVAISRAVGETMVVAIAAGSGPRNFASWGEALRGLAVFNPFKSGETMTGHIVRISGGDLSYDSIDYNSIFAIALMLFLITLALNIISQSIVRRYRMRY